MHHRTAIMRLMRDDVLWLHTPYVGFENHRDTDGYNDLLPIRVMFLIKIAERQAKHGGDKNA
ncbi:hypothetical protein [Rouxiella sp. Mn2063]|uniref:hypothetical protein n=1 Tax=Rouxiella sp. Mn2063 TaxID=3395262 RepID=UPI003BBC291D